jgi:hypothetical protein
MRKWELRGLMWMLASRMLGMLGEVKRVGRG